MRLYIPYTKQSMLRPHLVKCGRTLPTTSVAQQKNDLSICQLLTPCSPSLLISYLLALSTTFFLSWISHELARAHVVVARLWWKHTRAGKNLLLGRSLCDGFLTGLRNRHKAWRTGRYKASLLHFFNESSLYEFRYKSSLRRPVLYYSTVKRHYRRLAKN